jgi:signal transduction histidine kinase
MEILRTDHILNWGHNHFAKSSGAFRRWLLLYALMLTLGLLGDIAYCRLASLSLIWTQILPELHYIGVIFAAICFGAAFGLTAAGAAGILHIAAVTMTCSEPGSQLGQVVMFAGIGLTTGLISKGRAFFSIQAGDLVQDAREPTRASLSELGRMMPEIMQQLLTPIASIEGAGYVLEEPGLSDERRQEFVGIIKKECQRLGLLVELLDFTQSRFAADEETDLSRLIDEIVERSRVNTDSRIVLRSGVALDLPKLRCEPDLVKYALQVLITKGIRAIPKSGEVKLSANLTHGEIVINVEVRAEARGLPLNTSVAQDLNGTDMTIVQQIVNRHGGSIRVQPASEAITTSIILPLKSE